MSNEIKALKTGERLTRIRPKLSGQAKREVRLDSRLRQARTCYGHLAGVAGVALMDQIMSLMWLEEDTLPGPSNRVAYHLTPEGLRAMAERGVDVTAAGNSTGRFAFGCLDWTERRQHLGGALGRAVTACLSEQGLVDRSPGAREVTLNCSPQVWLDEVGPQR